MRGQLQDGRLIVSSLLDERAYRKTKPNTLLEIFPYLRAFTIKRACISSGHCPCADTFGLQVVAKQIPEK